MERDQIYFEHLIWVPQIYMNYPLSYYPYLSLPERFFNVGESGN